MLLPLIASVSNTMEFNQMQNKKSGLAYLSPRLLANQFIGEDNEGLLSISEYARFVRYFHIAKNNVSLIADAQAGFGNQLNAFYAAKDLGASGAAKVMINDQKYPSHSINPNYYVSRSELLGKIMAIKNGLSEYDAKCWLKLDGAAFYGMDELKTRSKLAAKAQVSQIVIGHLNMKILRMLSKFDLSQIILFEDNDNLNF